MKRAIAVLLITGLIAACDDKPVQAPAGRVAVKTGCYSSSYGATDAGQIGCAILPSSGNATIDRQSNEEYAILAQFYQLPRQPSMHLFDECPGVKNALSFPQGFILMGYNLLVDTAIRYNSLLPYAGVMAHEWGHQIQFQRGYTVTNASTARPTELAADAWAGYYLYSVKHWSGQDLETFLQQLFDLGNFDYNNPSFHGTPQERRYMGAYGMEVARQAITNNQFPSYDQLNQAWQQAIGQLDATSGGAKSATPENSGIRNDLLLGLLDGSRSLDEIERGAHSHAPAPF